MRECRRFSLLLLVCTTALAQTQPTCTRNALATAAVDHLRTAMAQGRFVAYEPTSLRVVDGRPTPADPAGIRADLAVLRPRFDSLITYGALHGAEQIPAIAASLRFRAVIIGVWNPFDRTELDAAISAARHNTNVIGLSLGNEMVFGGRRTFTELATLMASERSGFRGECRRETRGELLRTDPGEGDRRTDGTRGFGFHQ